MSFSTDELPQGLALDKSKGRITGAISEPGIYRVILRAANALGSDERDLRIVVGDEICLTPPMGWNSGYCWSEAISDEKMRRTARAFVEKDLINHGWTYINTDYCWEGMRGGEYGAIQGNERFPDMKNLCDYIHSLGLKVGLYSTPWMGTYGGFIGGSSPTENGDYSSLALPAQQRHQKHMLFGRWPECQRVHKIGEFWFADRDIRQFAEWGVDYVKYDWKPNDVATTQWLSDAIKECDRDIVFSLSNEAPFEHAADWANLTNLWRTTQDIKDSWPSITAIGFSQDKWRPFARPGHWNDPDLLQLGLMGYKGQSRFVTKFVDTNLTPDEQYTHVSLWCLLSAPLIICCNVELMDDFTLGLLTNDEVIAVNQDPKGEQARRVLSDGVSEVWAKKMEDGSKAVGLLNLRLQDQMVTLRLSDLALKGPQQIRDLWRQQELGIFDKEFETTVAGHGVVLIRISPADSSGRRLRCF
jgi:alpha-galactosidase